MMVLNLLASELTLWGEMMFTECGNLFNLQKYLLPPCGTLCDYPLLTAYVPLPVNPCPITLVGTAQVVQW